VRPCASAPKETKGGSPGGCRPPTDSLFLVVRIDQVVAEKFRSSMRCLPVCRKAAGKSRIVGVPLPSGGSECVFFVSVNQVLVRLWARCMEGRVQPIVRPTGREAGRVRQV